MRAQVNVPRQFTRFTTKRIFSLATKATLRNLLMLGVIYACVNFTLTDLSHDRMAWGHGTVDALRDVVLFTFDVFMYLFVVTFGESHARVCVCGGSSLPVAPNNRRRGNTGRFRSFWGCKRASGKLNILSPVRVCSQIFGAHVWNQSWHSSNLLDSGFSDELRSSENEVCFNTGFDCRLIC